MKLHTPHRPAAIATLSIIVIGLISGFNAVTTVAAPVADTGFGMIPASMKMRCSKADRMTRLKEAGGTPECEEAVVQGLNWLKSTQREEGDWPGNLANTGLALLAYLGHCETPVSAEYGDSCVRAMTFLINVAVKNKGWIATGTPATNKAICYEHAINTYAIAEATTFCRQLKINIPNLEKVCQVAGQLIIDNQTKQGGWSLLREPGDDEPRWRAMEALQRALPRSTPQ
ncbi:MAG: hypothetical protein K9N23_15820 [Akkermansiaceae bacterium]|nr:hypothetical protein [Akkermansiaceae bacterium]MCF7733158.1 hypothetical protein [Akkermansiaceae bacterium]